ncbi:hypothetical protein K7432_018525 [Basidiobolus ranarum]|uniref:GFO/IDH/MocA-like oxidoreductase domain-containing protein n=1 Tax=Basidiobolus ranarum TaxID=34480 RepID=A0ABR2VIX4_9FUNG
MMTDEERCRRVNNPPQCPKASDSLRIGLLSASPIAPNAIIRPAMSMSSVIIAGIAANDINRATIYAQEWASKKYSTAKHVEANFLLVPGICQPTDFRYSYELAGGALMDLGYVLSAARYFLGAEPVTCLSAKATPLPGSHEKVDNELEATLDFGKGKTAGIKCALSKEGLEEEVQEVTINTESHCLALKGYVLPHYGNTLTITELESGKVIKESLKFLYEEFSKILVTPSGLWLMKIAVLMEKTS